MRRPPLPRRLRLDDLTLRRRRQVRLLRTVAVLLALGAVGVRPGDGADEATALPPAPAVAPPSVVAAPPDVGSGPAPEPAPAPPRLALITCGGEFDRTERAYLDNIVAYAAPDPSAVS